MKSKKVLSYNIKYFTCVTIAGFLVKFFNLEEKLFRYIKFETIGISFHDFLSISITILSIFVGAIITVATILISMCDKRVFKLINKYKRSQYLLSTIKVAISTGILGVLLLGVIYSKLDFNILIFRLILLYIAGLIIFIFICKSNILINLIFDILNDSFIDNDDSIVIDVTFNDDND